MKLPLNYIPFFAGRFLSTMADQVLLFAIPLIIYQKTNSAAMSGLAFFIEWLPALIFIPFIGILLDYFSDKKIYIITEITRACFCILTVISVQAYPDFVFIILSIASAIFALLNAQTFIALETTIGRRLTHQEIPKLQSIIQLMDQLSMVLGPALAALLLILVNKEELIIFAGICYLLSSFTIKFISNLELKKNEKIFSNLKQTKENITFGFKFVLKTKPIFILVLMASLFNLLIGVIMASNPSIVIGFFHKNQVLFATLGTAAGIISILSLALIPLVLKKLNLILLGSISMGCLLLSGIILGLSPTFWFYLVGYCFLWMATSIFNVFNRSERIRIIDKSYLGKVISIIILFNRATLPIAGLLVAWLNSYSLESKYILALIAAIVCPINVFLFIIYKTTQFKYDIFQITEELP